MANELKTIAMVSLALLASVTFFQMAAMFPGRNKSLMTVGRKEIRGQEMGAVKQYRERIVDDAVVAQLTHVQNPREVDQDSGSQGRSVRKAKVDETESENGGSRLAFKNRKVGLKSESKRAIPGAPAIPGGPDSQHHE